MHFHRLNHKKRINLAVNPKSSGAQFTKDNSHFPNTKSRMDNYYFQTKKVPHKLKVHQKIPIDGW